MKEIIATTKAPAAIGPYSQGVKYDNLIFVSGQLPIDLETKELAIGIEAQTKASIENIKNILEMADSSLEKILKTTVFLQNMEDFSLMNAVYTSYFKSAPPARSTIEVARLPKDALVEIECIAHI